jgi:SAM-dependent methyltransferase
MPTSAAEGKTWIIPRIVALNPKSLLDIGAGAGTYAHFLRSRLPSTMMVGVEIFAPYVERYGLKKLYDHVLVGDARYCPLPTVDVVIMGDVLEHMPYEDAVILWRRARALADKAVFASLPIIEWPQGPEEGNEHEAHVHTWSHEDVMALDGVTDFWVGPNIGVYQIEPSHE